MINPYRLCHLAGLLAATTAAVAQSDCPAINFLTARQISLAEGSQATALVRRSDRSYTGFPHQTFGTYRRGTAIPNFQNRLAGCLPTPANAGAPLIVNGRSPGMASTDVLVIQDAANNTIVGVWKGFSGDFIQVFETNSDFTFKTRTNYTVGRNRSGMLSGDYNSDGKLDLAVLAYNEGSNPTSFVSVFLGSGAGLSQQQPTVTQAGAQRASSMAQGDYNSDGRLDLALTKDREIAILLGNGDGTFRAGATNAVAQAEFPTSVAAADLNGDSKLDLAVTTSGSNSVAIFIGNGDGTFRATQSFLTAINPRYVATADFNKDGRLDLAVSSIQNLVSILIGAGDGTFRPAVSYLVSHNPVSLVPADFNADGNLDIVVGEGIPEALGPTIDNGFTSVLLGNGDGTFVGAPSYGTGGAAMSFASADFNGDGRLDFAVANFQASIGILLRRGDGTFQKSDISLRSASRQVIPSGIVAADFNADNRIDLAVSDSASNGLVLLRGNGEGTFQAPVTTTLTGPSQDLAAADFNGDGRLDLAVALGGRSSGSPTGLVILLQQASGTFQTAPALSVGSNPARVVAGDLNGDSRADLVVVNGGTFDSATDPGSIAVLLGQAGGTFATPVQNAAGRNPTSVSIGDLDADRKPDLIVTTSGPNFGSHVAILKGADGGTFAPARLLNTDFGPADTAIGDFNSDGKQDVIVAHCCGETDVTFMLGNGDGTLQPEVHFAGGADPGRLFGADFNGDSKLDLTVLSVGNTGGAVTLLLNQSGPAPRFTNVSAAGFRSGAVAPESIVAAFGTALAGTTAVADSIELPTSLGGTAVRVRDSAGVETLAPLFFVSPGQVNYLMPAGTAPGGATITISSEGGSSQSADTSIARVAPGIFVLNNDRLAAAQLLRVDENGQRSDEAVFTVNSSNAVVAQPIDFGPDGHHLYLTLYATGVRSRGDLSAVRVSVGGITAPALYAGPQGFYPGLDQINFELPRTLKGRGNIDITVTADGASSNTVTLNVK